MDALPAYALYQFDVRFYDGDEVRRAPLNQNRGKKTSKKIDINVRLPPAGYRLIRVALRRKSALSAWTYCMLRLGLKLRRTLLTITPNRSSAPILSPKTM